MLLLGLVEPVKRVYLLQLPVVLLWAPAPLLLAPLGRLDAAHHLRNRQEGRAPVQPVRDEHREAAAVRARMVPTLCRQQATARLI